eukprot:TRINITY_DN30561_c0_g1_i3.p2 TRINITY_DN30561_c0_g1~~TRINITY_DN30561_c0_g1_i3.p2  ORF type:complete len:141 (-),score=31.21 TRINITY_DN30561_c0_g1_i3:214-636(-)
MIRRPPRSTQGVSSAASDVYKRQGINAEYMGKISIAIEIKDPSKQTVQTPPAKNREEEVKEDELKIYNLLQSMSTDGQKILTGYKLIGSLKNFRDEHLLSQGNFSLYFAIGESIIVLSLTLWQIFYIKKIFDIQPSVQHH